MFELVVGAAAGYVLGTKAGRRRYEQIRRGYLTAVNSEITRKAVHAGRKAIANRLDPEPRMHEIRDLNATTRESLGEGVSIVESDNEHPNDRIPEDFSRNLKDPKKIAKERRITAKKTSLKNKLPFKK
ncbi:hypothetical protein [Corynebacterium anserum]|uniref:hypothetical protein n=1 Tax=Corynebacterium anserum TaxID=2684406 RepID=UPI001FEB9B37|nr:hypothetical protein [Corynebacterium anserum]